MRNRQMDAIIGRGEEPYNVEIPCMSFETGQLYCGFSNAGRKKIKSLQGVIGRRKA
jgi:hypothetical protein